jgi:uncharacterized SAM-binding protein YcdF (DUF218 family)
MQTFLFYLSKILRPILASPLFLCLAVAAAALLALPAATKAKRILRAAGLAACAALLLASLPVTAFALAKLWETPSGSIRDLRGTGLDAVVVLGGSAMTAASTEERVELNDTAERLFAAAALYREGIAGTVVPTGGSGRVFPGELMEAPLMSRILRELGVPADRIVPEDASRNTYENATLTKEVLQRIGAKRIALVTSAWHMRRAAAIFAKAGYDFVPYAADSLVDPLSFPRDLLPDTYALDKTTRILTEMAGFVAYRLMGRL